MSELSRALTDDAWVTYAKKLEASLDRLQALVNEQAEDEVLWATNLDGSVPIGEAYLQQELRRLHTAIEGETINNKGVTP